ncbi:MAG: hypothetical protein FWF88_02165 [Peptococcaceae bacterium]|jgi:hypothetical protein|nr:hypothetical protein [Peptococcaceae bacterium]MCL1851819.1 hypothetical protein [Peptococcaceae bacterium]
MSNAIAIDYRNTNVIRKLGIDALTKELGPAGMAYFIQQYDRGEGDYTSERESLLADVSMDSLMSELEAMRQQGQ